MNLRTTSRANQWCLWAYSAGFLVIVYFAFCSCLGYAPAWRVTEPKQLCVLLPLTVVFAVVAFLTRWDGIVRKPAPVEENPLDPEPDEIEEVLEVDASSDEDAWPPAPAGKPQDPAVRPSADEKPPSPPAAVRGQTDASSHPGEAIYRAARAITHQPIPDDLADGEYLSMLGQAADLGYGLALAKLGEYALRRQRLIEAYYWMWMARRSGVSGLDSTVRGLRQTWTQVGYPAEEDNRHALFDEARASVASALLDLTTGRNGFAARKFLQEHHPHLLT